MAKIEQGIHSYFAGMKDSDRNMPESLSRQPTAPSAEVEQMLQSQEDGIEVPFAKVNSVAAGSPAAEAGMKIGDKVCSFGEINWMNHDNLTKIGDVVQRNEGVSKMPFYALTRSSWHTHVQLSCEVTLTELLLMAI